MWAVVIESVLPLLIKLIGMAIDSAIKKKKLSEASRVAFDNFVKSINESAADSARLRKSSANQRERLQGE